MTIWTTPITDAMLDEQQEADEVPFVGQEQLKQQVEPFLDQDQFPHVLLSGDPGLGKTQFARWIAWKRGRPFYERLAPVTPDELPPYGVMLIDEVHRQRNIEILFPTMDAGLLTLIAATTKPEKLDAAFRSRFLLNLYLRPYTEPEITEMMTLLGGEEAQPYLEHMPTLARASGGNPRQASLITRTAQALGSWHPEDVLRHAQVTADGLSYDHWAYLNALSRMNRPTGIDQLAILARVDPDDLKRAEGLLMKLGLIELRVSGRKLTLRGEQYVKVLKQNGLI